MKLELKHLAPYLPYGLKIRDLKSPLDSKFGIEILSPSDLNQGIIDIWNKYGNRKPILRPIADLTKEINFGLSTYSFIDLLDIGDTDGCIFEFDHGNIKTIKIIESIAKYNNGNDIDYLPYAVVKMMVEHHFDVFGLIDNGLAVDINQTNPSPSH